MGKLIITDAQGQRREIPLDKERFTIGRHPDNDLCLPDKAVSGKHAVIITILKDSFLEDLNSTNGTQVNGKPIAKHPLLDGDRIQIGGQTLSYAGEPRPLEEDDFEKTMVLKPGQFGAAFEAEVEAAAGAPPAAPPKPLLGKLRVISGPNQGRELELTKALTTLGRPGVQVAAITRRADGYYIVHVGGEAAGKRPKVNGEDVTGTARRLNDNDRIELAGTEMRFHLL